MADFYLPKYNIIIEYNGIQHYEPIERFGGDKILNDIKDRDNRKKQLCIERNITMINIPYLKYNNIEEILKEIIN